MAQYDITEAWVEATIAQPEHKEPDPDDPKVTQAWRRIPELGGRAIRVVFYPQGEDFVVVTTFPDRGAKQWLP